MRWHFMSAILITALIPGFLCGGHGASVVEFESAAKVDIAAVDTAPVDEISAKVRIRVPGKPYKGPSHMQFFGEFCLRVVSSSSYYVYTVCPFHNVTQLDTRVGDAVDVVLGTWHGWIIENNTYKGWQFYAGDPCEGQSREVKVLFECGHQNVLRSVEEVEKCHYVFNMQGPTFCNTDALLVYPFLSEVLQNKWDLMETHYSRGLINRQVYDELLKMMFAQEGLTLSPTDIEKYSEFIAKEEPKKFESQEKCEREFHLLKKENDILKSMTSKEALEELETEMVALRAKQESEENRDGHQEEGYYGDHGVDYDARVHLRDL